MRSMYATAQVIAIYLSFVVSLGNSASAADWRAATEDELRSYIVNTTLFTQTVRGADMAIYYDADGSYKGKIDRFSWGVEFEGKWTMEGNKFCTTRGGGSNVGMKTCRTFVTDGKKFRLENPTTNQGKRVKGNKLP